MANAGPTWSQISATQGGFALFCRTISGQFEKQHTLIEVVHGDKVVPTLPPSPWGIAPCKYSTARKMMQSSTGFKGNVVEIPAYGECCFKAAFHLELDINNWPAEMVAAYQSWQPPRATKPLWGDATMLAEAMLKDTGPTGGYVRSHGELNLPCPCPCPEAMRYLH